MTGWTVVQWYRSFEKICQKRHIRKRSIDLMHKPVKTASDGIFGHADMRERLQYGLARTPADVRARYDQAAMNWNYGTETESRFLLSTIEPISCHKKERACLNVQKIDGTHS